MNYGFPRIIPERPMPRPDRRRECWNLARRLISTIREVPAGERGSLEDVALVLEKFVCKPTRY